MKFVHGGGRGIPQPSLHPLVSQEPLGDDGNSLLLIARLLPAPYHSSCCSLALPHVGEASVTAVTAADVTSHEPSFWLSNVPPVGLH